MVSYSVIILCAGVGERLRPLTYDTPKALLELNGKPLLCHFLDGLIYSEAKIKAVHVVVGHLRKSFRKVVGSKHRGLKIKYLNNPLYKITGAAQSLYTASKILRRNPCIVLEGDHYLDPELMKMLMLSQFQNCILVDDFAELEFDEETLAYGYEGLLKSLKWLPPYPPDSLGEALTIFKMSKEVSNSLAIILENYLLEDGPAKREIIEPFNRLMRLSDFHYVSTGGRKWAEVDFERDLERVRSWKKLV